MPEEEEGEEDQEEEEVEEEEVEMLSPGYRKISVGNEKEKEETSAQRGPRPAHVGRIPPSR